MQLFLIIPKYCKLANFIKKEGLEVQGHVVPILLSSGEDLEGRRHDAAGSHPGREWPSWFPLKRTLIPLEGKPPKT